MFYFENRQLKKEIKTLDRDLDYEKRERQSAERKTREAETKITNLTHKLETAEKSRAKFKKLVREQTGADLLVNALIQLGVVPKPEENYDAFARQNALLGQLGQQQNYGLSAADRQGGLADLLGGAAGALR